MKTSRSSTSNSVKEKTKAMIDSQARELARKVLENCETERKNNTYKYSVQQALDRAVYYTGLSKRTLSRIKSESKAVGPDVKLNTPMKRRKIGPKFCLDDFERTVIYNTIIDFYLNKIIVPTSPKLLLALREKMQFPWGLRTLQRLLIKLGYRWRLCQSQSVLIENPDIVFKRYQYIKRIREYRQNNKSIFYLYEMWVENNLTFKKCWQNIGNNGIMTDTSVGNGLIFVNAGSKHGFLPGASLIFTEGTSTDEFHGQMNCRNFEKWVVDKLLPSLPKSSVVIMDNAPYRNVHINKPPTKSASKSDMTKWLEVNNIAYDLSLRKPELFALIEKHPVEVEYKVDMLIREHGHEILRLPPYMSNFNLIELVWAEVKHLVSAYSVQTELSLSELNEITTNAISKITKEKWLGFEERVQFLEKEYWVKDLCMEEVIEEFVLDVRESSDEDVLSKSSDCSRSSLEYGSD